MKKLITLALLLVCAPLQSTPKTFVQTGRASWYYPKRKHVRMYGKVHGKVYLAAHRTIRPSSVVLVETMNRKRKVRVTVCGYGPARWTRCVLDLSPDAFAQLAPLRQGHVRVRLRVIKPARRTDNG